MSAAPTATAPGGVPDVSPETLATTRQEVAKLFHQSESFQKLSPQAQEEIANNTVRIVSTLAEPQARRAAKARAAASADPYALALEDATSSPEMPQFRAQGAREGAAVAGALLQAVNFAEFVSGLIKGVFHAIVQASIEQMEAYGRLVADVAKTLNQFRDESTTDAQGMDHLVDSFPDTFMIDVDTGEDGNQQPRVRLRDGVDEQQALKKVQSLPVEGGPVRSLDDDTIQEKLVPAARTQLATSRQQLLATMVVMGINRIVVTDGRIAAKVLYDFQARDTFSGRLSATQFDYGDQYKYTSEGETQQQRESKGYTRGADGSFESRGGSYYAQGKYKNTAEPVLKLVSATNEQTDAALQTKASLAGNVDINFKSDYFPLEKMADSFQIARIQDASRPGGAAAPAAAPAGSGATPPPAAPPPQQQPATPGR
ncbi:MAG TPA: hypothetical protein VE596_17760 [Gaiellaceae bacterium]|jgi:hypothetical protein|nr:hypothetical protein [Gaiellaceae bacterium]